MVYLTKYEEAKMVFFVRPATLDCRRVRDRMNVALKPTRR